MSSYQRREQLIRIGRSLFASKGFEAVSVEEIAASAKVSKPIVYEHFGGKEGLYAVIVDREMRNLTDAITRPLSLETHPRRIVEQTALALLTYIEQNAEGFQVLARDSPNTDPSSSFSSLLGDVSLRVEEILAKAFRQAKLPRKAVPYYAQMLVGMTVYTGQYWAARRKLSKEQLAAHIVNLAWHGLSRLEPKPSLRFKGNDNDETLEHTHADHDVSDSESVCAGSQCAPLQAQAAANLSKKTKDSRKTTEHTDINDESSSKSDHNQQYAPCEDASQPSMKCSSDV